MAVPAKNKPRKNMSGSGIAALVILVLVIGVAAGYFVFSPAENTEPALQKQASSPVKPAAPAPAIRIAAPTPAQIAVPSSSGKEQSAYAPTVTPSEIVKSGPVLKSAGRLAIIIDDMGGSISEARSLAAIRVPLTFAIIPGLRVDKDVAVYAASNNIETMIHIPMQAKGWPERRLEANGLLISMGSAELQERVAGFVQQFPGAMGANNHMGSEFTEHEEKMTAVLQILKNKNMFFIDSVTSPESAGMKVAQQLGMKSARRMVFLDNEQDRTYIIGQLNQAIRLARKYGSAIAICHPHSATIAALATALPGLAGQGVSLVPASQLVK